MIYYIIGHVAWVGSVLLQFLHISRQVRKLDAQGHDVSRVSHVWEVGREKQHVEKTHVAGNASFNDTCYVR